MKLWKRPKKDSDVLQSLHDAVMDLKKGENLIYFTGGAVAHDKEVKAAAWSIAGGIAELVQMPIGRPDRNKPRMFHYILQRNG